MMIRIIARRPYIPQSQNLMVQPRKSLAYSQRSYKGLKFFNRQQEVNAIYGILNNSAPKLTLVTGPTDSGKSLLMNEVMEKIKQGTRPSVLELNMRDMSFLNVNTFVETFNGSLRGWFDKYFSLTNVDEVGIKDLTIHWKEHPPKLVEVFQRISECLPDWSILRGENIPAPILFIDEANLMRDLERSDENGQEIIKSIFTWFIAMTKEKRKFHIVLCSSDSFIHNWLSNFVGNNNFSALTIGHLGFEEAREFWETRVTSKGFYGQKVVSFEEMYGICGGSMFLLENLYDRYVFIGEHPSRSSYINQANMTLMKAMEPSNEFYKDPLKSHPAWKKEELKEVCKALASSKGGYVYYDELTKTISQNSIDSLIEYNIIHLRPSFELSKDLDPIPRELKPIITAESPIDLYVMKKTINSQSTFNQQ